MMDDDNKETTTKKFSRRKFIGGAVGLGVIAAGAYFLPKTSFFRQAKNTAAAMTGDLHALYVRQLITKDPATTRTVMWQSDSPLTKPAVEYRLAGKTTSQAVAAKDETFSDDGQTNNQYSAELTDLTPDTDYEYRVTGSNEASDWHKLHTAPNDDKNYKVLIFPDSQSSDYSDWKNMAQYAWTHNSDTAFFINMGDIVDNGEDHTQWQAWFNAVDGMIDSIPFAPLMGNHETYNLQWKTRLPEAYLAYFDVPENGSQQFEKYYYSFDYGDVHYIVLNTQWDEINDFKQGLEEEQIPWLREDVAKTDKKWKVVLMHRDVLRYRIKGRPDRTEGIEEVGDLFMPIFDELGIDVVFTAHLHTYRDRGRLYNKQPSDDKGPLYILTGVAGNVRYPIWIDHAYDKYVAPQPETDNYITMEVTPNKLTVKCFLPDGTQLDETSVSK